MDKKSLGAFVAVLRKSRGMTQRELAEKLGVSDKTVSHWERNESAPDISMIPVIAEIFDVTCDELLKGEKTKITSETSQHNTQKQQKYIFEKNYSKFRTQCLIFTGVAFAGLVFAFLSYWMWAWEFFLVDLIFFIVSVFGLVITKVQNKSSLLSEDSDDELTEKYQQKSREIFWYSILTNVVLTSVSIGDIGLIISPVFGSLFYLILRLTKQITFKTKGQIIEKNIIKTVSVTLVLILIFTALFFGLPDILTEINTPDSIHFENIENLKNFIETEKSLPAYATGERGTNVACSIDYIDGEYVWKCYSDSDEEILVEFVWRNNEIQHIDFTKNENGKYFADVYFFEHDVTIPFHHIMEPVFYTYYPVVIISAIIICIFKTRKKLKDTEN